MYSIIQKSRALKDGTHRLIILVRGLHQRGSTSDRPQMQIKLPKFPAVEKKHWSPSDHRYKRSVEDWAVLNQALQLVEDKCERILQELKKNGTVVYNDDFVKMYEEDTLSKPKSVLRVSEKGTQYKEYMRTLKSFGSARIHKESVNCWLRFIEHKGLKEDIPLHELSERHVMDYFTYMAGVKNNRPSTCGIRLRDLATWFNHAVHIKEIPKRDCPTTIIPTAKLKTLESPHDTMELEDWVKLKKADVSDTEAYWLDLFKFMMFANGINFLDMMTLTYSKNVRNGRIVFHRLKTRGRTEVILNFNISPPLQELMDKFKIDGDDRVIPGSEYDTGTEKWRAWVDNKRRYMNKQLNKIAPRVGLEHLNLTAYVSRHSVATIYYHEGVPISHIKELLGHSTEKQTVAYLKKIKAYKIDDSIKGIL